MAIARRIPCARSIRARIRGDDGRVFGRHLLGLAGAGRGLFDRIFGGSERLGRGRAQRAALRARSARRTVQRPAPTWWCASIASKPRSGSSPASSSSCSTATSSSRPRSAACRRRARAASARAPAAPASPAGAVERRPPTGHARPARRRVRSDAASERARRAAHARLDRPAAGPPPLAADAGEQPIGAPGGRGAGAPLDLATMSPPGGPLPAQPPRNPNAGGALAATLPPSQTPRDEFDLAYGYVLRKDYALAEDGFRNFLSKYPNDRLAGDATYLARREPVPAPALPRRRGSLPQRLDQVRIHRQGARRAASARAVARRARREGSGLRLARRGPAQISARIGGREAGRRARTEACPLLTMRRRSPPPRRRRCSVRSLMPPPSSSRSPAVPDSTALLVLAARWRARAQERAEASRRHGRSRVAAANPPREARAVKRLARRLGVPHRTLRWQGRSRRPDCRRRRARRATGCWRPPPARRRPATSSPRTRSTIRPRPC